MKTVPVPNVKAMHVTDAPGLDLITVLMRDVEPGRGQLTILCYGCAWTAFWGAMGSTVDLRTFVSMVGADYVANCLFQGRRAYITSRAAEKREMDYLLRITEAVLDAIRQQQESERAA